MRDNHIAQASLEFTAILQPQPHSTGVTVIEPPYLNSVIGFYQVICSQPPREVPSDLARM